MNTTDRLFKDHEICSCGCGTRTASRYLPGHDAKHVARLRSEYLQALGQGDQDAADAIKATGLGTPALTGKLARTLRNADAKIAAYVAKAQLADARRQAKLSAEAQRNTK